jgi:hypothetical protein
VIRFAGTRPFRLGLLVVTLAIAGLQLAVAGNRLLDLGWTPLAKPASTDFGNYYVYAQVGLHHGWNSLYDLGVQRQEWLRQGGDAALPLYPMIYPPPLAWVVAPIALLPMNAAVAAWAGVILALYILTWKLAVPGDRLTRLILLAASFCLWPVVYGLALLQAMVVMVAVVTVAWWLLGRRLEVLAGLVLVLLVVKPQVAFLVPVALLAAGRWRAVATWAIGVAAVVVLALFSLGPAGIQAYAGRLARASSMASEYTVFPGPTLASWLGSGLVSRAVALLVVAVMIRAAWRHRSVRPDVPVAAGLVASILVTPYIHLPDLTVLLVAGWILLRGNPPAWLGGLLLGAFLLVLPFSFFFNFGTLQAVLVLALFLTEVAWLVGTAAWRPPAFRMAMPDPLGAEAAA